MPDRPYAPLPGHKATYQPPGTRDGQAASIHQVDRAGNTAVISLAGATKRLTVKLEHLRRPTGAPQHEEGDEE